MTVRTTRTAPAPRPPAPASPVTLLILGAGWTYQFLEPVLGREKISHAATTTTGRGSTIPFRFDSDSDDLTPFQALPDADYVLVTFPLKGRGPSTKLVRLYNETRHGQLRDSRAPAEWGSGHEHEHGDDHSHFSEDTNVGVAGSAKWIQLGSTGIWTTAAWNDESSAVNGTNARAVAEDELIALGGCVLNLAGLYGGGRNPRNWIARVAGSKKQLGEKGALHLIHGHDVARAVVGVVRTDRDRLDPKSGPDELIDHVQNSDKNYNNYKNNDDDDNNNNSGNAKLRNHLDSDITGKDAGLEPVFGRRWIVADCVSYDWWSLVWDWMGESAEKRESERESEPASDHKTDQYDDRSTKTQYRRWVAELMDENNVRGLPRSTELLGRKLDARRFWKTIGILPDRSLAR